LLASACSSADVAATVNGVEIDDAEVFALANHDEDASSVRSSNPCQREERPAPDQVCVGFRDDLTVLVFLEGMIAAAEEDFGITGVGTDAARNDFFASASPEEQQLLQTLIALPGRGTEEFLNLIVDQLDIRSRVQTALIHDEENLKVLWEQRPNPEIDYCIRHISVASSTCWADSTQARTSLSLHPWYRWTRHHRAVHSHAPPISRRCPQHLQRLLPKRQSAPYLIRWRPSSAGTSSPSILGCQRLTKISLQILIAGCHHKHQISGGRSGSTTRCRALT
jgi:hypothetical protein